MRGVGGFQLRIVERLRAQAKTIEPTVAECSQEGLVYRGGIALDRHFRGCVHDKGSPAGLQDAEELTGREDRGRPTAKVDRLNSPPAERLGPAVQLDLRQQIGHKGRDAVLPTGTSEEGAEVAPPVAERHVEIQSDAVVPWSHRRFHRAVTSRLSINRVSPIQTASKSTTRPRTLRISSSVMGSATARKSRRARGSAQMSRVMAASTFFTDRSPAR